VLKAAPGYKFAGTITPTTGGAGTPSVGTIGGGDTAENTLSFTVSFPATAAATSDSVIGTWRATDQYGTYTYVFKNDGALEYTSRFNGEAPHTSTYAYDSATKRIDFGWEPNATYSVSGNKLFITQTYPNSYVRHGDGSGLSGVWRESYGEQSYYEYVFGSDGKVIERNVSRDEVEDEEEYSYTTSGNKLVYTERLIGRLSGDWLIVSMDGDGPISFTRQGSGSGIAGTWRTGSGAQTVTAVITPSQITVSGGPQAGQYPCRINGNNLYVKYSWEASYRINTSGSSDVLTLTEEFISEFNRVN
jgi:hypothetical protein